MGVFLPTWNYPNRKRNFFSEFKTLGNKTSIEKFSIFLQNHNETENEIINFLLHHKQKILSNLYKSAENFRKSQQ